jgi:hypothetical protein
MRSDVATGGGLDLLRHLVRMAFSVENEGCAAVWNSYWSKQERSLSMPKFLIITKRNPNAVSSHAPLHGRALSAHLEKSVAYVSNNKSVEATYSIPPDGAVTIVNVDTHERLNELLFSYPGILQVTCEVYPLADALHALKACAVTSEQA